MFLTRITFDRIRTTFDRIQTTFDWIQYTKRPDMDPASAKHFSVAQKRSDFQFLSEKKNQDLFLQIYSGPTF